MFARFIGAFQAVRAVLYSRKGTLRTFSRMSVSPVVAALVATFLNHCYYDNTPIARVASGMVDVANDLADTFHPRGDFRHEHAESQKA